MFSTLLYLSIIFFSLFRTNAAICFLIELVTAGGMLSNTCTSEFSQLIVEIVTQCPLPVCKIGRHSALVRTISTSAHCLGGQLALGYNVRGDILHWGHSTLLQRYGSTQQLQQVFYYG